MALLVQGELKPRVCAQNGSKKCYSRKKVEQYCCSQQTAQIVFCPQSTACYDLEKEINSWSIRNLLVLCRNIFCKWSEQSFLKSLLKFSLTHQKLPHHLDSVKTFSFKALTHYLNDTYNEQRHQNNISSKETRHVLRFILCSVFNKPLEF